MCDHVYLWTWIPVVHVLVVVDMKSKVFIQYSLTKIYHQGEVTVDFIRSVCRDEIVLSRFKVLYFKILAGPA